MVLQAPSFLVYGKASIIFPKDEVLTIPNADCGLEFTLARFLNNRERRSLVYLPDLYNQIIIFCGFILYYQHSYGMYTSVYVGYILIPLRLIFCCLEANR